MNPYQQSTEKVRAWLEAHFDGSGSYVLDPDEPRFYPKAPYLLHTAGLRFKGARVARRVGERFLDAKGDFTSPGALENRVYAMGWLALGAMMVERFDLAQTLAHRLAELQDPQSGGIVLPDADAGEAVAEVCFSGGAGMAFAATGHPENARRMADRFAALLDAQPDPRCFYNRFRRDGSVVARPAAGEWKKMYHRDQDEQRPANFATVINTLVWTGRALRDRHYFKIARRYVDLVYQHRLDPARFGRATKFGWSLLNLYEETGEEDLLQKARHLGDVLVAHQSDDGLWDPQPGNHVDAPPYLRLSYSSDCAMTIFALANGPSW